MVEPLVMTIPHTLGREEATRRMSARIEELPDHIPGGVAAVEHRWTAPDRLALDVSALGAQVATIVEVTDTALKLHLQLPPLLQPFRGAIEAAVKTRGARLLLDERRVAGGA